MPPEDDKKIDTDANLTDEAKAALARGDDVKSPLDAAGKGDPDGEVKKDDKAAGDKLDDEVETPEEKAEREKEEAEAEAKKRIRIPKSRLDEAQSKARAREQALLEEIDRLKGGQVASATQKAVSDMKAKITELQDKYEDLILDGKKDDARKVRKQVEAMREELIEHQTSVKSDAARSAAIEDLTYNASLANYEATYPELNPDHDDFDADKTDEVAELLNSFVKSGQKRAAALAKAVRYVLGAPATKKDDAAATEAAKKRAEEARKKAAEADKKQPPNAAKVGLDSDKGGQGGEHGIDVMRLSQDKFAKLDDEVKAKLRGDEV
jgi:hypothetical protein